jgi:amino acid permease
VNIFPIRESVLGLLSKALGEPVQLTLVNRAILGAFLVFGPAGVAVLFPNVISVISLLGGLGGTMLMIVFPAFASKLLLTRRAWMAVMAVSTALGTVVVGAALHLIGDRIPPDV